MSEFRKIVAKSEIPAGSGKAMEVDGNSLAIFNVEGNFYAVDNTCLHKGGPLGEGSLDGSVVTCPWHGWNYDVKTGANIENPEVKVKAYEVKLEGDEILVKV